MTNLQTQILRPKALALFEALASTQALEGLTLIGGTALALQIGHRFSRDFDFATYENQLPWQNIDTAISQLEEQGTDAKLITNPADISQFKINTGKNLLRYARDYSINGIKVTFFAHGKSQKQREYYQHSAKIPVQNQSFCLLGLDALKTTKILVLADRVRSRDLFDLMVLMRDHDYTVTDALKAVETLGHNDDVEYYKAVMNGTIPLDKEDEGLEAVSVSVTPDELYAFFDKRISEYEQQLAEHYFSRKN